MATAERFPPLPTHPLTALPGNVELVAHLNMARARGTDPFQLLDRAREDSCLGASELDHLWGATDNVALGFSRGPMAESWSIALKGDRTSTEPLRVLESLSRIFPTWRRHSEPTRVGRLQGFTIGPVTVARVGEDLIVIVPAARFADLARAYENPTRSIFVPRPALVLEPGMLELWDHEGRVGAWLQDSMPTGLQDLIPAAPLSVSLVANPAGLSAQARTQLQDDRQALHLATGLSTHLRSHAWLFGLLGLPALHERIKGQHNDSIVEFHVNMTRTEASRLLNRMRSKMHGFAENLCRYTAQMKREMAL